MDIGIADLDDYLKKTESSVRALRPDCEKKIVWANEPGLKSATSVVYIHGFSATHFECSPVIEMVAESLGANLFFTRLRGHGQDGKALGEASFDEYMEDTLEAIEIGGIIGDKLIVIGCSTGCSLIHLALNQGASIKSAIYIAPNFGPKSLKGKSLRLPGADFFVPLIFGKTHSFTPKNNEHARCWTTSYPTKALFAVR
ncbi:MAG: alpha/beta hydrolase, partial [Gammaproteobacteria bacterium]|nr:alpha/beta hydrolase [Gammaproteobacteria bacterium]